MYITELFSKRLTLRLLKKTDLQAMHELSSIPEVEKYNTLGIPRDMSVTKKILKERLTDNKMKHPRYFTFAIEEKEHGKFIGLFGIVQGREKQSKAEIWYKLHPATWNKGYATEAVNCALDFCFNELKLHRVEAGCAVENIGSIRVLEKTGFQKEGLSRMVLPLDSGWSDGYNFGILETDVRKV